MENINEQAQHILNKYKYNSLFAECEKKLEEGKKLKLIVLQWEVACKKANLPIKRIYTKKKADKKYSLFYYKEGKLWDYSAE